MRKRKITNKRKDNIKRKKRNIMMKRTNESEYFISF